MATDLRKVPSRSRMGPKKRTMAVVPKKIRGDSAAAGSYQLKKGQPVLVNSLGKIGIVDSIENDYAELIVGSFKIKKPLADIIALNAPSDRNSNSQEEKVFDTNDFRADDLDHGFLRVDFHGLYVDEAIDKLDKLLDDALLKSQTKICVVHGHGSGQLKNAIREYCKDSPYVKAYRPGELHEGGDGLTLITVDLG